LPLYPEEAVVVGIFEADLEGVVIDITDGKLCPYSIYPEYLELKIDHCACGICVRV
jgi:hypothetical protein